MLNPRSQAFPLSGFQSLAVWANWTVGRPGNEANLLLQWQVDGGI